NFAGLLFAALEHTMKRRGFMMGMGAMLASRSRVRAQQTKKLTRIALVVPGSQDTSGNLLRDNFKKSLAEAGYEDGKNIALATHFIAPQVAVLEEAIPKVVSNVDLLVVWGTIGVVTAKKMVPTLPTVFIAVGAPVDIGVVETLSHPGG